MASLALIRPDEFEHFYSDRNLDFSTEGGFWLAANTVLGSRWQLKMPTSISSKVDISKGPRRVAFHHAPGATVQSGRSGTFLRQPGNCSGDCQAIIDVTAEVHRLSNTYIAIGLPRTTPPSKEMYEYAIHALIDVLKILCSQDSTSSLYVFPTKARKNPQACPVRPRTWFDQTPGRSTFEIYTHQVWIRSGNRPFLCFLLGHDRPRDELFCPALLEAVDARDSSLGPL